MHRISVPNGLMQHMVTLIELYDLTRELYEPFLHVRAFIVFKDALNGVFVTNDYKVTQGIKGVQ